MSLNTPNELRSYLSIPAGVADGVLQTYLDVAAEVNEATASAYDNEKRKLIELNLAAHYISAMPSGGAASIGNLESIKIGQSEERYRNLAEGVYKLGNSVYGQMVNGLDNLGLLASLSANPLRALFKVY